LPAGASALTEPLQPGRQRASLRLFTPPAETDMSDEPIKPIMGWSTATSPAGYGAIVIEYLPDLRLLQADAATADRSRQSLLLGIGAEQCDQLAQDLQALAERLRAARTSAN
jgi:hypothetical protein